MPDESGSIDATPKAHFLRDGRLGGSAAEVVRPQRYCWVYVRIIGNIAKFEHSYK
jgi:hypothetical protein